ncbi:MAG: H-NS histone family protein [Pseudomonadota bacterium]|nr:H-NS histone family protein [Pseudomonadota bacterium]
MAVSLSELIAQREALERQIQAAQDTAKAGAVAQVRKLMAEHGLTAMDLIAKSAAKSGTAGVKKVAAKYRDPISGSTWTGRGLKPKWLAAAIQGGKTLEDFAI